MILLLRFFGIVEEKSSYRSSYDALHALAQLFHAEHALIHEAQQHTISVLIILSGPVQ